MATEQQQQQRQALSAFSLLVDVANAQSRNGGGSGGGGGAAAVEAATVTSGGSGVHPSGATAAAAAEERMLAIREAAILAAAHAAHGRSQQQQHFQQRHQKQQQQQQQHHQQELEALEIQEALQRELIHREAMRRQAALVGLVTGGGGAGAVGGGLGAADAADFLHSNSNNTGSSNNNTTNLGVVGTQEAQYLQQLRLEALVHQRRQETLAQLALAQELGMSQENMAAMLEAEQIRQAALIRQEMLLSGRVESLGGPTGLAAALANGGGGGADGLLSVLATSASAGNGGGDGGGDGDEGILQLLQERERQRKLAALLQAHQAQQQHQQQAQAVGSAAAAFNRQGHGMERADLIGSVFSKNAAAIATIAKDEHQLKQKEMQQQQQKELEEQIKAQRDRLALQLQQQVQPSPASLPQLAPQPPPALQQIPPVQEGTVDTLLREKKLGSDESKTTILPCRARGMPLDHNVKTAYFVTHEDIKHGTELVCSYFACRNAGIKFRYCVYCKLPVAKRNFAKRHRHWGKIAPGDLPRDVLDGTGGDDDLSTSDHGTTTTTERINGDHKLDGEGGDDDASDGSAVPRSTTRPTLPTSPCRWNPDELLGELMSRNVAEVQQERGPPEEPLSVDDVAKFVDGRKELWEGLLLRRPRSNSRGAMLAWIQDILRISDMEEILPPPPVQCKVVPPPSTASTTSGSDTSLNEIADCAKSEDAIIISESKSLKEKVEKENGTMTSSSDKSNVVTGSAIHETAVKTTTDEVSETKSKDGVESSSGTTTAEKEVSAVVVPEKPVTDRMKDENDDEKEDGEVEEDDDYDGDEIDAGGEEQEEDDDDHEDGEIADDASTSSEDSVDLRVSKKARTS